MKKKFIKGLALTMAMSTLLCNTAFATPIDLRDSVLDVQYDSLNQDTGTTYYDDELTNEWNNGTIPEEVKVRVDLASQFEITIPKEIVLDGSTGKADYKVKAVGDIAGDQKLSVVPDPDFVLSEAGGKADVTATVVQPDTEYVYTDLQGDGTEYDGAVQAGLTAGEWSGRFIFNIYFNDNENTNDNNNNHICDEDAIEYDSWDSQIIREEINGFEKNVYEYGTEYIIDDFYEDPSIYDENYSIENDEYFIHKEISIEYMIEEPAVLNFLYAPMIEKGECKLSIQLYSDENGIETYEITDLDTANNLEFKLNKGFNHLLITFEGKAYGYVHSVIEIENTIVCKKCSVCGHIHKYTKTSSIEGTCSNEAYDIYSCECGKTYKEYFEKNDYNHIAGENKKCILCGEEVLNAYSWEEISNISELGLAEEYFDIGDEKEIEINNEKYTVQILGFEHDELSDNTNNKAGITFGLKEIMNNTYIMNSSGNNIGGWDTSTMREYLQNNILPILPNNLQEVIKTVNKNTSIGNSSTNIVTSEDKLFLLSEIEVFNNNGMSVSGEGKTYEFYNINSNTKYKNGVANEWWLRSPFVNGDGGFCYVETQGGRGATSANTSYGVSFAFCI